MHPDMESIQCSIIRGGTSKGVYILESELPKEQEKRDDVIRAIFGSPDTRQIDGLGGADTLTSKLAIVGVSQRADADVEYTFAQVDIGSTVVDYDGNCGNISSGVGPFAIDAGLVRTEEPVTTVRIYQTNSDRILRAEVPVIKGKACADGTFSIAGVPGTGAKIVMDFSATVGAVTNKLLPTGNVTDRIMIHDNAYEVSIVDAGNPVVFMSAKELGLEGIESAAEIDCKDKLLEQIEEIRSRAAALIGMNQSSYIPFFAIVSSSASYVSLSGEHVAAESVDIVSRLLFMQKMHKTYPGTGAVCTAAAVRIPGTIPYQMLRREADKVCTINIGHPAGVMMVESIGCKQGNEIEFQKLAFYRTARKIMDGIVYIKKSILS